MDMEETQMLKQDIRNDVIKAVEAISPEVLQHKNEQIENRLFEFANFLEANISLLYIANTHEVDTKNIIIRCLNYNKLIALPVYNVEKFSITPYKIDDFNEELKTGPRGLLEPDPERCKAVPIDRIDIAIFPGMALDEKGGRIGSGDGYCDRLVPRLPITTRKVALAYECQIVPQVPMESHDKYMDIIITEERIIYKI
jgi:5-formyltetrahydrofolate cyclo-ligase